MGVSWYTGDRQKLFEALLKEVARTHAYDAQRVYVVGSGEGGHVAVATGLRHGDMIAAVAACNPPLFDGETIELMRKLHFTEKVIFPQTLPEIIFPQTVPKMLKEAGKVKPAMLILAGKADKKLRVAPRFNFTGGVPVERYADDSGIPLEYIEKMVALLKDGGVNVEFQGIAGGHYNPLPEEQVPAVWEFLKKHSLSKTRTTAVLFATPAPTGEQKVLLVQPTGKKHGLLGVTLGDGAVVQSVALGSAAVKAGLQVGDAIVRIDDRPIKQTPELTALVRAKFAGDKIRLVFVRGGKEQAVEATLGQSPQQPTVPSGLEALSGFISLTKSPEKPVKGALRAVAFLDDKVGYAVGDEGLCQTTVDGGETWRKIDTGSKATYRAILLLDKDTVYLCGDGDPNASAAKIGHIVTFGRPMQNSTVTYTRDGGKTWTAVEVATNFMLTTIARQNNVRFLVGTSGGAHLDGDVGVFTAGGSWSDGTKAFKGGSLKADRAFRALSAMCRFDDRNYAAIGSPVSVGFTRTPEDDLFEAHAARAIFSSDGGKTWKPAKGSDGLDMLRHWPGERACRWSPWATTGRSC